MLNSGIPIYIHCIPWTYMNIPLAASEHPCSRRHRSVDVATPHASAESGAGPSLWTSFILGVHSFKFYVALHGFTWLYMPSKLFKCIERIQKVGLTQWPNLLSGCLLRKVRHLLHSGQLGWVIDSSTCCVQKRCLATQNDFTWFYILFFTLHQKGIYGETYSKYLIFPITYH